MDLWPSGREEGHDETSLEGEGTRVACKREEDVLYESLEGGMNAHVIESLGGVRVDFDERLLLHLVLRPRQPRSELRSEGATTGHKANNKS